MGVSLNDPPWFQNVSIRVAFWGSLVNELAIGARTKIREVG